MILSEKCLLAFSAARNHVEGARRALKQAGYDIDIVTIQLAGDFVPARFFVNSEGELLLEVAQP